MPLERAILAGLCGLLFLAPLPFGCVTPGASAVLITALLGLGVPWVVWRVHSGFSALPWKDPVFLAGLLIVALGIVQTTPVPEAVLQGISSRTIELGKHFEPPESVPDGAWRPISMFPWASRVAILRTLAYLGLLMMSLDLATSGRSRRAMTTTLIASGGFQAAYGLWEFLSDRQHIFGYAKQHYTDVATGTFINRNHFAGYLEMTLPLTIGLAATMMADPRDVNAPQPRRWVERLSGVGGFKMAVVLLVALTMATALVSSRSRMGIVCATVALLSVGGYLLSRGRGRVFAVSAVVVTCVTGLLFSQGEAGLPLLERYLHASSEFHGKFGRLSIWMQSIELLKAFPWLGTGVGTFAFVFPAFRTSGAGLSLDHAHNDFLEFAVEVGAIGSGLVIVALLIPALSLWNSGAGRPDFGYIGYAAVSGVAALLLHSLADFNLSIPSNAMTMVVLLALVVAWRRVPAPVLANSSNVRGPRRMRAALPGAAVLSTLACVSLAPVLIGATGIAFPSKGPLALGPSRLARFVDPERVIKVAGVEGRKAIDDLHALLQGKERGLSITPEALTFVESRLERAIALEESGVREWPMSGTGHLLLGNLNVALCAAKEIAGTVEPACLARALREFLMASELNPMDARMHAEIARILVGLTPLVDSAGRVAIDRVVRRAVELNGGGVLAGPSIESAEGT